MRSTVTLLIGGPLEGRTHEWGPSSRLDVPGYPEGFYLRGDREAVWVRERALIQAALFHLAEELGKD